MRNISKQPTIDMLIKQTTYHASELDEIRNWIGGSNLELRNSDRISLHFNPMLTSERESVIYYDAVVPINEIQL